MREGARERIERETDRHRDTQRENSLKTGRQT